MTIRDIIENKSILSKRLVKCFAELIEENFEIDLEKEEVEEIKNICVTNKMIKKLNRLIKTSDWNYFDFMKILEIQ